MKLNVMFSEDKVVFDNPKTGKVAVEHYIHRVENDVAIKTLRKEIDGRGNVTEASLSILIDVLNSDRLAGYRGKTPANETLPKDFKAAMREVESAIIRPLFLASLPKSMSDIDKSMAADKYVPSLWAGGVYSLVKNAASSYFCCLGKLPCMYDETGAPVTNNLLSVDTMKRLLDNAKDDLRKAPEAADTIKDKFVRSIMNVASDWDTKGKGDKPIPSECRMAIAALRTMLNQFEAIEREYRDIRVKAGITVNDVAASAIVVPAAASTPKAKILPKVSQVAQH